MRFWPIRRLRRGQGAKSGIALSGLPQREYRRFSDAELARDLRLLVRERLTAGDTDAQARDFIVDRYGEFVLLKPTASGANLVLWLAGPLMLVAGGLWP